MDEQTREAYNVADEYHSEDFAAGYQKCLQGERKLHEAFVAECLHKIYQPGRLSGTKLLDFGSGPTVHKIASATIQFSDITLAEWSEASRNELKKWLDGDKDALDWTPLLEICAGLEGHRNLDAGVAEIEERIRKAVKNVISCDILSDDIIPNDEKFDVINCCYCFESVCLNTDMYRQAIQKLTKHLKKGGSLVMASVIQGEYYAAHKTLHCLYLKEDVIKDALLNAGLELRDWFLWKDTSNYDSLKCSGKAVHYSIKK